MVEAKGGVHSDDKECHVEDVGECRECGNSSRGCESGAVQKVSHWV